MNRGKNFRLLVTALRRINDTIYAVGAPHGTPEYFRIREIAVNALKTVGEPVSLPRELPRPPGD